MDPRKKYGKDDHKANLEICEKLGIENNVISLINGFGFANTGKTFKSKSIELKICVYSDMRVSPQGITSLRDRFEEAKRRYLQNQKGVYKRKQFEKFIPMWTEMEKQIFTHSGIKPEDITEGEVHLLLNKLRNFEIITGN